MGLVFYLGLHFGGQKGSDGNSASALEENGATRGGMQDPLTNRCREVPPQLPQTMVLLKIPELPQHGEAGPPPRLSLPIYAE